jgi:Fur family transcriptional regulator, ferric uptake regulator
LQTPQHSLRMTDQRRIILEELRKVHTHPTANEVYDMVRKRLPRISLGTVYRNLEILSEIGAIQKLELAGTQKRFDGTVESHYHVRCLGCGRVEDVPVGPMPTLDRALNGVSNYKVFWHRLEFMGLCPRCQEEGLERLASGRWHSSQ